MSPIEVETGPMFSGKTRALLDYAEKLIVAGDTQGIDFLVFNHFSDTRYGENVIGSHGHITLDAIAAQSSKDIFEALFNLDEHNNVTLKEGRNDLNNILVDEAQFFDKQLGQVLQYIDFYYHDVLGQNINIVCAGLDLDFKREPFKTMADLLARADKVNKFTAVCKQCPKKTPLNARYSQRFKDGKPAEYSDQKFLVSAVEKYTARCKDHHELTGVPVPHFED